jgi:hypothetical protein
MYCAAAPHCIRQAQKDPCIRGTEAAEALLALKRLIGILGE